MINVYYIFEISQYKTTNLELSCPNSHLIIISMPKSSSENKTGCGQCNFEELEQDWGGIVSCPAL